MTRNLSYRAGLALVQGFSRGATLLRPETTLLVCEDQTVLDIGASCYMVRESGKESQKRAGGNARRRGRMVDPTTLSPERVSQIRSVVEHVQCLGESGELRPSTIGTRLRAFIRFLDWADVSGHTGALRGGEAANAALTDYIAHLRERVRAHSITPGSATAAQSDSLKFLRGLLDEEGLGDGLRLIVSDRSSVSPTIPPNETSQARVLAMCDTVFSSIAQLLLDGAPYPLRVAMPGYLPWSAEGLWVFPTTIWCEPPHLRGRPSIRGSGYDYERGRLFELAEIAGRTTIKTKQNFQNSFSVSRIAVDAANADRHHPARMTLATLAAGSFLTLFMAQTGMNWEQAKGLPWGADFAVDAERQRFRAIKARAKGREVVFELPSASMARFRLYLALRVYLCEKKPFDTLFPPGVTVALTQKRLRILDPDLPRISNRMWRAAKSDWLIRATDVSTAALVLQNSEATVRTSYAAGSEGGHISEMTAFLGNVAVSLASTRTELDVASAVGSCSSVGAPLQVIAIVPVKPDCRNLEGCLFCEKFKVHSDERDARKLLSCRLCVEKTAHLFRTVEHQAQVVAPVLGRLRLFLAAISEREPDMVARVTSEVYEDGDLDPYWAGTIEMLLELGALQ